MYSKNSIIGFKGFDKDLKCRGFQYEVGKTYEQEGEAVCCEKGFHFCENPLEVFYYYPPCTSRFCQVEGGGSVDKSEADSKVATSHIHISEEIGLNGLIDAGLKYILDKVDCYGGKTINTGDYSVSTRTTRYSVAINKGDHSTATNTGFYSAAINKGDKSVATNCGYQSVAINKGGLSVATNTGNYSVSTNSGAQSVAANTGNHSVATNTSDHSVSTNSGAYSVATNSGYKSAATSTSYQSAATNSGYKSAATNTGDHSVATNTGISSSATNSGDYSSATSSGKQSTALSTGALSLATVQGNESVAIVTGKDSMACGTLGSWIVLTERGDSTGETNPIKEVKAFKVDGVNIKENIPYKLVNGQAVAVI